MDWPGNSPDLNPIENCWNQMKQKLKDVDISSLPKLKEAPLKLWTQDLSKYYLASLSASMPRRIAAVIKKRRHDQVLGKAIVYIFFQKYFCFFKLARFLFPENMCFLGIFYNRKPVFLINGVCQH